MLRLTPSAWDDYTLGEFLNAIAGRSEIEESLVRGAWERTRWQTAALLNVHASKGRSIKPKDLIVFPWEESVGVVMTDEQRKAIIQKIDEYQAEQWRNSKG